MAPVSPLLGKLSKLSAKSYLDEEGLIKHMLQQLDFSNHATAINKLAKVYATAIKKAKPSMMEAFMRKYNLSSVEGAALMCLSEALLRIPDDATANALIEDKLKNKHWRAFLENSGSMLVNASAWGLLVTDGLLKTSNKTISKWSRPLILKATRQAMKIISKEFIMGYDIPQAIKNSRKYIENGYRISFDILGESSRDTEQAEYYFTQYLAAVQQIGSSYQKTDDLYARPNISVKLSALHPRFELTKRQRVMDELLPKLKQLVNLAMQEQVTISFDAEEATRLDIYLELLTSLLQDQDSAKFHGVGFVVQAYGQRSSHVIDFIADLAKASKRKIPVRLVKGAYWDSEIKLSQEAGLENYPVYTQKNHTDVSYIFCANKMLQHAELIYPQFATHNAVTMAYIKTIAQGRDFEFQKLHGMGNALHRETVKTVPTRIYAPVGQYQDLLAYLMRRMLENGANTSFVYQSSDPNLTLAQLTEDPLESAHKHKGIPMERPSEIFHDRRNSLGYDLGIKANVAMMEEEVARHKDQQYKIYSIINGKPIKSKITRTVHKPADLTQTVGEIHYLDAKNIEASLNVAAKGFHAWQATAPEKRAALLEAIADKFHEHRFVLYSILMREGGKNIRDSIAEVREAIDFARYYAQQARAVFAPIKLPGYTGESNELSLHGRGVFLCISPWNFPLAIFAGQVFAALVAGNTVIAKPADHTSIIAHYAVQLMLEAGIPASVLQLVLASGRDISKHLLSDNRISGVCFTGSNETARHINRTLAARDAAIAPLIAETGGQNAMIVDSSALLEQVCDSVIQSAFGSIGQRCSALRVLYVQEEVHDKLMKIIIGAMQEMTIGDTEDFANDLGPVISTSARDELQSHIKTMTAKGCKLVAAHHQHGKLKQGAFFVPHILHIKHINDLEHEVFGPVLHVRSFKAKQLDEVIAEINSTGFGLTFGAHSRINSKLDHIQNAVTAGNIYINRSTIGAQVGTQPFGGEGLSGTGFKAGGPHYLLRFCTERVVTVNTTAVGGNIDLLGRKVKA